MTKVLINNFEYVMKVRVRIIWILCAVLCVLSQVISILWKKP